MCRVDPVMTNYKPKDKQNREKSTVLFSATKQAPKSQKIISYKAMPVKETSCQSKSKTSYSNAHAPVSRSSKIDIGFFFLCYLCFHQVNPRTNIELGWGDKELKSSWRYVSNLTVYFHQMFRFRIPIISCSVHDVTQFKTQLKF